MTVRSENGVIHLEGICPVEDAEILVAALDADPAAVVELGDCRQLHSAVVQVLLVFRPSLRGEPNDLFLRGHLTPAVMAAADRQAFPKALDDRTEWKA